MLLDKEPTLGKHGSGRNSGVLHSGIYYPPGTLKAKYCAEGSQMLKDYCEERKLPLKKLGKVILPVYPADDKTIDILLERGRKNGVTAHLLDERTLREIEPLAFTLTGSRYPRSNLFRC